MKKISLLLLIFCLVLGASGGYGYYILVLEDDEIDDNTDDNSGSGSSPIARISPSNPKIQINETVTFSASDSTDSDGDKLSFTWNFEGDSKQYEGETIERTYPDGGEYYVVLLVTDSSGLNDEAETTVSVVEDYHADFEGDIEEDETNQIEFPVESGVISVYIEWDLTENNQLSGQLDASAVNLILKDAQGNSLENENNTNDDGSWSINSERLDAVGDYEFIIEGENGDMHYNVDIDVSY